MKKKLNTSLSSKVYILLCIFLLPFLPGLSGCASHSAVSPLENVVAIWDVEGLGGSGADQADLGEFIAAKVMEVFSLSGSYSVVEREKLLLALEELELGTTELVDESTRLRLGHLLKARYMVFGGYFLVGDTMRLDLRLVEVDTGAIIRAASRETAADNIQGWIEAAAVAARELL